MSGILNTASYVKALKRQFGDKLVDMTMDKAKSPFVQKMKRDPTFGGEYKSIHPMVDHSGGSSTFQGAMLAKGTPTIVRFDIDTNDDYFIGEVLEKTIALSRNNASALAQASTTQVKNGTEAMALALCSHVWGNGGGSIGRIAAGGISGNTITLTEAADMSKFTINMLVEIASDDGNQGSSNAGVRSGVPLKVTKHDYDTKTLTFDSVITANYASAVANDYLFRVKDYANVVTGVQSWIPVTAPTPSDSFWGVNRSIYIDRLSGLRQSTTGSNIEHAVIDACSKASQRGAEFDHLFLDPEHYAELEKQMYAKTTIDIRQSKVEIGNQMLSFRAGGQTIVVIADRFCPNPYGLLTKMSDWELWSVGELFQFATSGGGRFGRSVGADAIEFRQRSWRQVVTQNPGNSCLITWGT